MVKKKASDATDDTLGNQIKDSAQQIWLAGMGAFARAQAEGTKRFEALVKEGGALQKKTQSVAEDKFGEIASRMSSLAGEVQAKAGQQWGKLDSLFDDRTAKALKTLGVPTANDLSAMQARLAALEAKLASLTKTRSAAAKKPAKASVKPTGMPASREMERGDELSGKSMPAGLPAPKPPAVKTQTAAAKKGVAKSALKRHLN